MLSKLVCMKCVGAHKDTLGPWVDVDDLRWDRGLVLCPYYIEGMELTSVYLPPNNKCLHRLEHGVAAGMPNDKH